MVNSSPTQDVRRNGISKYCFFLLALSTIFLTNFLSPDAFSLGGMDSGGSGLRGYESNPWFIGKQVIPYCIKVDPSFPRTERNVRSYVKSSIVEWDKFQTSYGLRNKSFNLEFPDGKPRGIDLTFVETVDCQSARLKFMVGVRNPQIDKILESYPPKTLAFAHALKTDFESYTLNSSGIIWISSPYDFSNGEMFPPYNLRPMLSVILMHEIGHVFGLGHQNKYSFMNKSVFEFMSEAHNDPAIAELMTQFQEIDNPTPIISFGRDTKWIPRTPDLRGIPVLFKALVGEEPASDLQFVLTVKPDQPAQPLTQLGVIQFNNNGQIHKFQINFSVGMMNSWPTCKIKLSWKNTAPDTPQQFSQHGCLDNLSSEYLVGKILDKNGTPLNSKVSIGTRQRVLKAFGGSVNGHQFNIHLKTIRP